MSSKHNRTIKGKLRAVRWKDEPGEVIRRRIYPIVASIEQEFRAFINKALMEIIGFTWSDDWLPTSLRKSIEELRKRDVAYFDTLHPLEMVQFSDLLDLVTKNVAKWQPDAPLSTEDVRELLDGCSNLDDVRRKLDENTKQLSMWDDVFALYFADRSQWTKLASTLRFVINERHKVMHHQPMRFGTVAALDAKQNEISKVLSGAKRQLSASERATAEHIFKDISDTIMNAIWISPTTELFNQMADQRVGGLNPSGRPSGEFRA